MLREVVGRVWEIEELPQLRSLDDVRESLQSASGRLRKLARAVGREHEDC